MHDLFFIFFFLKLCLDCVSGMHVCVCLFFFFFLEKCILAFPVDPFTVYETYKHLFSTKFSLKMGFMALFIYLKIILL